MTDYVLEALRYVAGEPSKLSPGAALNAVLEDARAAGLVTSGRGAIYGALTEKGRDTLRKAT